MSVSYDEWWCYEKESLVTFQQEPLMGTPQQHEPAAKDYSQVYHLLDW